VLGARAVASSLRIHDGQPFWLTSNLMLQSIVQPALG
jgi:hypothetical protein